MTRRVRIGPAAAAERGEPAPPPPQLEEGGVPRPWVQPQPQPDPQVPDPVPGQPPPAGPGKNAHLAPPRTMPAAAITMTMLLCHVEQAKLLGFCDGC